MIKKILINCLVVFYACLYPSIGWTNYTTSKTVSLVMTATDQGSGMAQGAEMKFSNDGQNWSPAEPFAPVKTNWDLTDFGGGGVDGQKTVYLKLKDAAGNWSTVQIVDQIILDQNTPSLSVSPNGGTYNQNQTVTVTANEPASIYYTTDGTLPTKSSPKYAGPIIINGPMVLSVFAEDSAGNISAIVSEVYDIPLDTDFDGMPDSWELLYGLNINLNDGGLDNDNDGYSNYEEYLAGWNPTHNVITIYVDDDGPQDGTGTEAMPFRTVSQAIEQAIDGDTILVLEGNYLEGQGLLMKERVDLVSEVGYQCVIDLQATGFIEVADYCTVSGFKIINPQNNEAAISCVGTSPTIFNNVIIPSQADAVGIFIADSSSAQIHHNTILDAFIGIEIDAASPTITNNVIVDNDLGIKLNSGNPLTADNNVWGNIGTPGCPDGNYCGLTPGPNDKSQDPRFWAP